MKKKQIVRTFSVYFKKASGMKEEQMLMTGISLTDVHEKAKKYCHVNGLKFAGVGMAK